MARNGVPVTISFDKLLLYIGRKILQQMGLWIVFLKEFFQFPNLSGLCQFLRYFRAYSCNDVRESDDETISRLNFVSPSCAGML